MAVPIPIQLTSPGNAARMKFYVQLPTNERIQINLVLRLLTPSKALPLYSAKTPVAENLTVKLNTSAEYEDDEILSSTTTTEEVSTSSALPTITTITEVSTTTTVQETTTFADSESSSPEPLQIMTVEEAIEAFRQHLIQKEIEIAGIIESDHPFYRHFNLEYDNDSEIPIRCTYDANYEERALKISCYEYRQYGTERIFSSGEFAKTEAMTSSPEYINVRNMKQTYNMTIT